MLSKLKQKTPNAKFIQADILEYSSQETYDYIFISSSSVSLFTNIEVCLKILEKLKRMLTHNGKFVFAVDTVTNKLENDDDYKVTASVKTKEGLELILKVKIIMMRKAKHSFLPESMNFTMRRKNYYKGKIWIFKYTYTD